MTQPFDTTNATRYTVWVCYADKPDTVYATYVTEWDADMIVNEMNSIDDTADYRYCEMGNTPEEQYAFTEDCITKEFSENLHRFQTGTF